MIALLSVTNIGKCLTRRRETGWGRRWRQAFCSKTAKLRMWKGEKLWKNWTQFNSLFSCSLSVSHPFLGDYVRLRQNVQWKKICVENNDQYVVFADIINKIARSSGKVRKLRVNLKKFPKNWNIQQFVPILLVLSTSSMLLLDQRTLQIKYRVPASEIYRMSLSPYLDDIAVFHVKAVSSWFISMLLVAFGGIARKIFLKGSSVFAHIK